MKKKTNRRDVKEERRMEAISERKKQDAERERERTKPKVKDKI